METDKKRYPEASEFEINHSGFTEIFWRLKAVLKKRWSSQVRSLTRRRMVECVLVKAVC